MIVPKYLNCSTFSKHPVGLYLSPKLLNEFRLSLASGDYATSYTSLFLHSYLSHIASNLHEDHTEHQKFTQRQLSVLETTYPEMRRSMWLSSYQRTRAMPQLSSTLSTTNRRTSAHVARQGPRTVRGKQEVFRCRKWLFKDKERLLGSVPPRLYGFPRKHYPSGRHQQNWSSDCNPVGLRGTRMGNSPIIRRTSRTSFTLWISSGSPMPFSAASTVSSSSINYRRDTHFGFRISNSTKTKQESSPRPHTHVFL
jgi:hypothetical protein